MKRTYDELVMGSANHELAFGLYEDGKPGPREAPMFHDSVQRVLFGDPAFTAWKDVAPTSHAVELKRRDGKLRVSVHWKELRGDPWVWDPWRDTRHPEGERGRVYERITLERDPGDIVQVTVLESEVKAKGDWKPLTLEPSALIEIGLEGEPVLHLKGSGARADMNRYDEDAPTELRVVFEVTFGM